jgi:hypothetical protein
VLVRYLYQEPVRSCPPSDFSGFVTRAEASAADYNPGLFCVPFCKRERSAILRREWACFEHDRDPHEMLKLGDDAEKFAEVEVTLYFTLTCVR